METDIGKLERGGEFPCDMQNSVIPVRTPRGLVHPQVAT
jgi:hypothetical protein